MDVRHSQCERQQAAQPASPEAGGGAADAARGLAQQLLSPEEQEQAAHAASMEEAFAKSEAAIHSQWDLWAGVSLSVLLLLALPSSLQREHWKGQLAAVLVEVGIRVGPAWLACLAWGWYWPHRTLVVAACRLASAALPRLAVQPALPTAGWGGWHHFLLLTRALGVNTLPWLARLPFKWFVWVHLVSVVDAARLSLGTVCGSLAFTGSEAQQRYASATRAARLLSTLAPTPSQQSTGGTSCLDRCGGGGGAPALGTCACRQMAVYSLACLGYALPLAVQFVLEAAARRRFYRRHCCRLRCDTCAAAKGTDVLTLAASAALLLAGFCAVAWQLAGTVFVPPPDALPDLAGGAAAPLADACGAGSPGACRAGF